MRSFVVVDTREGITCNGIYRMKFTKNQLIHAIQEALDEQADVHDIPSEVNVRNIYDLFISHMDKTIGFLDRIKAISEDQNRDVEGMRNMLKILQSIRDDDELNYDVENW